MRPTALSIPDIPTQPHAVDVEGEQQEYLDKKLGVGWEERLEKRRNEHDNRIRHLSTD